MQVQMNWKVLTSVVLAIVLGGGLFLAGNYAVTSYVVASAQQVNRELISSMMSDHSKMDGTMQDMGDMQSMMHSPEQMKMMADHMAQCQQMMKGMMDMMSMMHDRTPVTPSEPKK